jgi:hypothetical protein
MDDLTERGYESYDDQGGDCANFGSLVLQFGAGGVFGWGRRFNRQSEITPHKKSKYLFNEDGRLIRARELRNLLVTEFNCSEHTWDNEHLPESVADVTEQLPDLRPGDFAFWDKWGHITIF